ncbi:MAG: hypothetical protein U1E76_23410 [Planctomycetota bacterium]
MNRALMSLVGVGVLAVAANAQGPASELYIADGGSSVLSVVQGSSVVRSWVQRGPTMPIAVISTVRTYLQYPGGFGSEYDLAGNWTGIDYPDAGGLTGQCVDGATDGVSRNWLAGWNDNSIWQFDLNWGNPTLLFGGVSPTGVTYDQTTNHLWVIDYATSSIIEFDLAGNQQSSFSYGSSGEWLGCLAWEPATDTLWAEQFASGELRQYDKAGNLLQSVVIPGLAGYAWGGEFQIGGGGCAPASAANYGTGWPGTNGTPTISSSGPPSFGSTITISISNSLGANTTGALILGLSSASIGTPLGGTLLVIPYFIFVLPVPIAGLNLTGTIPNNPIFCQISVYLQALEYDAGASKGVSFTDGLQLTLGS